MAFVPGANCVQVELKGSYNTQFYENTLYFQCTSAVNATNVGDLMDFLENDFLPDWLIGLSDELFIDEIYVTDMKTVSSPTYSRTLIPALEGTETGSPGLPGSVAACISFRTANRGRSARGRNYVSGLTENNVTGNAIDVGQLNFLVAAYELLLGGGSFPAAWTWVVFSRYLLGSPRVAALIQDITDVLSTDITADSQRGRLR